LGLINSVIDLPGIQFGPITFTPRSIPAMAPNPKFVNEKISGILLKKIDRDIFRPYLCGIALVKYFYDLDRNSFKWKIKHFDRLCGTDQIRQMIKNGKSISEIREQIDADLPKVMGLRAKYLLY